ncbi:MAG: PKD domain-containing protein, partial [Candidatus Helarchaeota archaeon]|nr:PKD domain-containing protein [Candidatus Helarchaeota archaeon]
ALDSPIHVHLTWQHETNTTMTVTWQTTYSDSGDLVLFDNVSRGGVPASYRLNATGTSFTYTGASGYIHVVELVNLTPDTVYYFICGGAPSEPKGGYTAERAFRTSPSSSRDIRFVAGGDSRTNEAERAIVSQAMAKFNPEFVLHVGDMVEVGSTQSLWETWFTDVDTHWIGTNNLTIPIMPVIGNHEGNAINYYQQFALPGNEMWYSYDWGPDIHITCLSTETTVSGEQQTWLENDLKEHANFTWKIVISHQHPVDGSTNHAAYLDLRTYWVPLFDKYHVDIMIMGHSHIYMRTVPMNLTHSETEAQTYANGTLYVISGAWGAPLQTPGSHWYNAYTDSIFNFCVVDVFTNRTLHLQAKNDQGITFDEAWIIKPPTTTDDYDGLWHSSNFTINLAVKNNFTGNAETYYRINGGPILNVNENGQPSITTEGANNRLEYWSVGYNNSEELHNKLTGIKLDKASPVANAGSNTTVELGALMIFNGSASTDNFAIKNSTWTFTDVTPKILSGVSPSYAFSSLGTYQVTLNVSDYAGWWDTAIMWVTVADLEGPTTTDNYDGLWHVVDFSINLTASDNLTGVAVTYYKINDGILQNIGENGQPYINTEGSNNKLEYWSMDLADNEELPHIVLTGIKLDKTSPVANAGSNRTIEMGGLLMFNGSGSADNVAIKNYTWTFTDGTPEILTGVNSSHVFNGLGTYEVTLNVSDYAGWWDVAIVWVTVIDSSPPTANFTFNPSTAIDHLILFNASGSTDNGTIIKYTWDFGDGNITTSISPLISHFYLNAGTYLVNLTVTDEGNNTASAFMSIEIQRAQKPFPGWVVGALVILSAALMLVTNWSSKQGKMKKGPKEKSNNTFRHLSPSNEYS